MSVLYLPLKGEYFDAIRAGTKPEEFRLCTPYWRARLAGTPPTEIELMRGYPAKHDTQRRLRLPWRGYTIKTITHAHFGPSPVEVFAIYVAHAAGNSPALS